MKKKTNSMYGPITKYYTHNILTIELGISLNYALDQRKRQITA